MAPSWVVAAVFAGVAHQAASIELSKATWDTAVAGKSVFVKFYAPWCGHCKKMKPAWDKLMEAYKTSTTVLVADVDCVGEGKSKCDEVGVKGFPTIKYGDPNNLQEYKGSRSYDDLLKHAQSLGPSCGPAHLDLCNSEQKKQIQEFTALSAEDRAKLIAEKDAQIQKLEAEFTTFVDNLSKQYHEASAKKDKDIEAVKAGGFGLLKEVQAFQSQGKKDEL